MLRIIATGDLHLRFAPKIISVLEQMLLLFETKRKSAIDVYLATRNVCPDLPTCECQSVGHAQTVCNSSFIETFSWHGKQY